MMLLPLVLLSGALQRPAPAPAPATVRGRPRSASTAHPPRCADVGMAEFSPAYDTTVRYAAVDWAKNMRTLHKSRVLQRISSPLLFNFGLTFVACLRHAMALQLPNLHQLPHTLLGSALGLLLVFRTNAAYDRFWEARKMWGVVTSECRALASLASYSGTDSYSRNKFRCAGSSRGFFAL